MEEYSKFLHIKNTLLNIWDPIGVSGLVECSDEYDSYAYHLLDMLMDRKSRSSMFYYLYHVEAEIMGFDQANEFRIKTALDEILSPYPLAIFEFVYQSKLAYQSIEERQLFLKRSRKFKNLGLEDQEKIHQVCSQTYYPPADEAADAKLWHAMEYLDPVFIFERNSEGPFLRVSLLLALMEIYGLSLEDFLHLWQQNMVNLKAQQERETYRLIGML